MTPELTPPALAFDLKAPPYGLPSAAKSVQLVAALNALTAWHRQACEPYDRMAERLFAPGAAARLADVPYLPVRLFKTHELRSVSAASVIKTLRSSGTTGHAASRIFLDRETSMRQTRALGSIMTSFVGDRRLPMVIVDSPDVLESRSSFNARAAGILGFSTFGRNHFHCLDEHLRLRPEALAQWLDAHRGSPVLAFGFTFVVWQGLYQEARRLGLRFDFGEGSLLVHGGGWKRLADQQVSNDVFKSALLAQAGLRRVHNYYGMVEQVGSIFMECEHGHLHAPAFADVVVRDPATLAPLAHGQAGLLQVLSALPVSYPGHSLLTEDLGVVHGEDDCPCGRLGRHFSVLGRLPQSELRGCSDTRVVA